MTIPNELLMPGDIIFVASKGIISEIIKFRQAGIKSLKDDKFIPTHVALVISASGMIIEATTEYDVDVYGIHKFIDNKNYEDTIIILRNKELENNINSNPSLIEKYYDSFTANWREKYNYAALLKKAITGKKFCSELAVECLIKETFLPNNIKPASVYPLDLLELCMNTAEWREIKPAALLSLSKLKINQFFDESISQIKKIKPSEANLETCKIGREIGVFSEEEFTAIMQKVSEIDELLITLQNTRENRLLNESNLRSMLEESIEHERYWLITKRAELATK